MRSLAIAFACLLLTATVFTAAAQPAHACGQITSLSVVYATVDNFGIAPRPMPGSESQFNCIAARDPNFQAFRADSAWKALNYWYVLYSQELGVNLQPLPPPSG